MIRRVKVPVQFREEVKKPKNQIWFCKRCGAARGAQLKNSKPKVVRFPTGYVAVYLECGHTAAVNQDRI